MQCGGEKDAVEAATPFLKAMGKKIWHCGGPSTGHAAKVMPRNAHHLNHWRSCPQHDVLLSAARPAECPHKVMTLSIPLDSVSDAHVCSCAQVCNNMALAIQMASIA